METSRLVRGLPKLRPALITALAGSLAIVLIALTFWWIGTWKSQAVTPVSPTPNANQPIEDRWGIRIHQVGVTAAGGLIDLRYLVIDPDKAAHMFDELETIPQITTEDGMRIHLSSKVKHHIRFETGRTYYILYRNPHDAIKPGSIVSVLVGDTRVDGIVAQ